MSLPPAPLRHGALSSLAHPVRYTSELQGAAEGPHPGRSQVPSDF